MKKVGIVLLILILIIAILAGVGYFYSKSKLDMMNYVEVPKEEIEINEEVKEKKDEVLSEYRNIVLLGKDDYDTNYENGRSDCIIIASINEKTKEVNLVSVYRDTYLQIPGRSLDKVNHAYAYGGPALTMSTLNKNLDLDITEFVTVNFEATKDIVNAVGGVSISVTDAEATKIPGISKGGTYLLDGEKALAYARIRKIDSDYKRTERMRTVLEAVFEKAKKMNPTQLMNLMNIILPEISTNIPQSEIVALIPQVVQYKVNDSIGWPYKTQGIILNDVWYGPPITLRSNVIQLHKELFGEEDYQPSEEIENISKSIVNKTGFRE